MYLLILTKTCKNYLVSEKSASMTESEEVFTSEVEEAVVEL